MTYARIAGGIVAEIIPTSATPIEERFHPDIVATLVAASAEVAEGWLWDGQAFAAPPPPPSPAPAPIRIIAPLAFRRRLGVRRAALTLAASAGLEAGDATLQVMLDDIAAAKVIDLDEPELVAGVRLLVARSLLSQPEAVALLRDGTPAELA